MRNRDGKKVRDFDICFNQWKSITSNTICLLKHSPLLTWEWSLFVLLLTGLSVMQSTGRQFDFVWIPYDSGDTSRSTRTASFSWRNWDKEHGHKRQVCTCDWRHCRTFFTFSIKVFKSNTHNLLAYGATSLCLGRFTGHIESHIILCQFDAQLLQLLKLGLYGLLNEARFTGQMKQLLLLINSLDLACIQLVELLHQLWQRFVLFPRNVTRLTFCKLDFGLFTKVNWSSSFDHSQFARPVCPLFVE